MAWIAIRRRYIEQHREWMIRSVVVTFGFVIVLGTTIALDIGSDPERFIAAAWMSWSVPLFVTELWLQARRMRQAPRDPRSSKGATLPHPTPKES